MFLPAIALVEGYQSIFIVDIGIEEKYKIPKDPQQTPEPQWILDGPQLLWIVSSNGLSETPFVILQKSHSEAEPSQ